MGVTTIVKAGVYSLYWDTLGGGEYYAGMVAKILEERGYKVELFSPSRNTVDSLNRRFKIGLNHTTVNQRAIKLMHGSILAKWLFTSHYDVLFFVSDGSIPFLFGKKNLLHFQVPFKGVGGGNWLNQLKLRSIHHIICNSEFTKRHIDEEYNVKSQVIYPSVRPIPKIGSKQKIILSVGRFDGNRKGKRQDVLVDAFKKMKLKNWRLILAGGVLETDSKYVASLTRQAKGCPISIDANCSFAKLTAYYQAASLFWHAQGFGTDMINHPQNTEHFGISAVEAMTAGAIPLVFNGGGLPEIVDEATGYTWDTIADLESKTKTAIYRLNDKAFINRIVLKSHQFSKGVFDAKFVSLLG